MTDPKDPEETPDVSNDPVPEPAGPEPDDDGSTQPQGDPA